MLNRATKLGIALGCAVATVAGFAAAQFRTGVHTAAECQLYYGSPSSTVTRTALGAIENTHTTQELWITCPLTRYETDDKPQVIKVYVRDRKLGGDIACASSCYDFETYTASTSSFEHSDDGFDTLSIDPGDYPGVQDGFCTVGCVLPDLDLNPSSIISYYEQWDND